MTKTKKTRKNSAEKQKPKPKYVYEFTNKRKLTKSEFLKWFQKKFLYIMRKFKMTEKGDVIGYHKSNGVHSVVLGDLLKMFSEKAPIKVVTCKYADRKKKKIDKFAGTNTSDSTTMLIIDTIINHNSSGLKEYGPVYKDRIQPLYLFLDKEVELYAKLKNLKYKTIKKPCDKLHLFIEDLEKKHPELKHSVIKTYLDLFE